MTKIGLDGEGLSRRPNQDFVPRKAAAVLPDMLLDST
jgi:hypothetical protein